MGGKKELIEAGFDEIERHNLFLLKFPANVCQIVPQRTGFFKFYEIRSEGGA
jgi:hypothetical protein